MGHIHFCVAEIPSTVEFWQGLGFELMAEVPAQAAFLASGGYHHHVGANTWQSAGAPYAPEDRARLIGATIYGASEDRELVDPSGAPLTLSTAG
jgi:catechol 2,3-dioxygenase